MDTSLIRTEFFGRRGVLIRGGPLYIHMRKAQSEINCEVTMHILRQKFREGNYETVRKNLRNYLILKMI